MRLSISGLLTATLWSSAPASAEEPTTMPAEPTTMPVEPTTMPVAPMPVQGPTSSSDEPAAPVTAPEKKEPSWTDKLSFGAFVDAYYAINYNFPKNPEQSDLRVFDQQNGFALSWTGLDVSYDADPVGATIALRFGPTARRYNFDAASVPAIEYVKEAFVTWRPMKALTLDFGRFGTIYGAEVAESWQNINYTRGLLNGWAQPFHHTGLRVGVELPASLALKFLAVNGWDNVADNNTMKSFGVQLGWSCDTASVLLGYMLGPEQDGDNGNIRHFVDLVATLSPMEPLQIVFNADFLAEDSAVVEDKIATFFGLSLAAQLKLSSLFALGARVEYLHDQVNARFQVESGPLDHVVTGTLTLDIVPAEFMLIRLDVRGDFASRDIFKHEDTPNDRSHQITTTLGVVVYTG